jgi:hypothetical protein
MYKFIWLLQVPPPTWTSRKVSSESGSRIDSLTGKGPYVTLETCFARENAVAALQSPSSSKKRGTESSAALGRVLAAVYGQGGAFEKAVLSRKRRVTRTPSEIKEELLGQLASLQEEVMGAAKGVFEDCVFSSAERDQLKAELLEALANLDTKMRETDLKLEEVPGALSVFNSAVDSQGDTTKVILQQHGNTCLFADDALGKEAVYLTVEPWFNRSETMKKTGGPPRMSRKSPLFLLR